MPPTELGVYGNESDAFNGTDHANQTLFDYLAEQTASVLNVYYTPLLVGLGSLGNLLSVFVFYASKLRLQSTSHYLSALALSDTMFLMQLLPPWLNAVRLTGVFHHEGFCQLFVYVSYVCSCLSAWLVVAFTVERFVAVLYPLRRNAVCTVSRARLIITIIVVGALLLNLPVLRFAKPTRNDCNIDYEYMVHAARFNLVDTAVSFTAPLAVIIVLNSWIMVGVCQLESTRQQLLKAEQTSSRPRPLRVLVCPKSQQRVTRMLLLVSSVFVVLNVPAYTMRIIAYACDITTGEHSGRWAALQQVALMFFNTNFGINFILYCLSGQNFRRALTQTMPFLRYQPHRAVAVRRTTSFHPGRASSVSASYASACTEATVMGTTPCARRRRWRYDPGRTRWIFDNSRQRAIRRLPPAPPSFEMTEFRRSFDEQRAPACQQTEMQQYVPTFNHYLTKSTTVGAVASPLASAPEGEPGIVTE